MRRMFRVKNPWFCVEKEGYPLTPRPLVLADSQAPPAEDEAVGAGCDGDERPEWRLRPGEAQPPPGMGEGLLERDMAPEGLSVPESQYIVSCSLLATMASAMFRSRDYKVSRSAGSALKCTPRRPAVASVVGLVTIFTKNFGKLASGDADGSL